MDGADVSSLVRKAEEFMSAKILIAANTGWNLVNFRTELIRKLIDAGYEVVAAAPQDAYVKSLPAIGCRFVALPMDNKGTNLVKDFILLVRFYLMFRRERPDIYLGFTVKPNIYGSLAAQAMNIPVINNITGLGSVFIKNNLLTRFVSFSYRLALSRSSKVFFHGPSGIFQ